MNVLDHFSIPHKGLKDGIHHFTFDIDDAFFAAFENPYVEAGKLEGKLEFDKRPDLAIANLIVNGIVSVPCDRCLSNFELEIASDDVLHVKVGEEREEEDEVLFISADDAHINFAKFVYDSICLTLPMVKMHENTADCDPEVIAKLNQNTTKVEGLGIWGSLAALGFDEEE